MARLLAETGRAAHFMARSTDEVISLCQRAIEMAERQGEQEARVDAIITIALRHKISDRAVHLLQEAIAFSEANKLWRQASSSE